jgi:uncharacterized BrkB/YihY/UPF0761 family membrane protein
MTLRVRFYIALASSFVAVGVHLLANNLYLYWTYKQIDILVHIIGGIMAGLYTLVFLRAFSQKEDWRSLLVGVLLIGVGWEILELYYKVGTLNLYYWLDTIKDLIDDAIGGYIAFRIWKKIPEVPNIK